jgi:hypothetical protein
VIGAEAQWDAVLAADPHALALLSNPDARIGARGFAQAWARHLRVPPAFVCSYEGVTMDDARAAVLDIIRRPPRLVVLEFGEDSARQQNAVLKAIEDPGRARVVVIGSRATLLPTVLSRCMVVTLGLLGPQDLERALRAQGMDPDRAKDVAIKVGVGSVEDAHRVLGGSPAVSAVANVARALAQKDRRLLESSIDHWDEDKHRLFMRWLVASAAGRPLREVGSWQIPRAQALPMWRELCDYSGARPELAMAVAVASISENLV